MIENLDDTDSGGDDESGDQQQQQQQSDEDSSVSGSEDTASSSDNSSCDDETDDDTPQPSVRLGHKVSAETALLGTLYRKLHFLVGCRHKTFSRQSPDRQPTHALFVSRWTHSGCCWTKTSFVISKHALCSTLVNENRRGT